MVLDSYRDRDVDRILESVPPRLRPAFTGFDHQEQRATARYLFPRRPTRLPASLKSRVIGLYCPMADRSRRFPDGLRWSLNVYVGCLHACGYCYVNGYSQTTVGVSAHEKRGFARSLRRDLQDLATFGVPRVPLHMSNSTDPMQAELETRHRHTLLALTALRERRERVSQIVMLTKNPAILCEESYLEVVGAPDFQPFTVQVTCGYWRDEAREFYEPQAPTVESRLRAIEILRDAGVNVELRIDPLFPSSSVGAALGAHGRLATYGLEEAQPPPDLESLVAFAARVGCAAVVAKPLRVPHSGRAALAKAWFGQLLLDASPSGKRVSRGRSWRLPDDYQKRIMRDVHRICATHGIPAKHCMHDVLSRR